MRDEAGALSVGNIVRLRVLDSSAAPVLQAEGILRGMYVDDKGEIVLRIRFAGSSYDSEARLNAVITGDDR